MGQAVYFYLSEIIIYCIFFSTDQVDTFFIKLLIASYGAFMIFFTSHSIKSVCCCSIFVVCSCRWLFYPLFWVIMLILRHLVRHILCVLCYVNLFITYDMIHIQSYWKIIILLFCLASRLKYLRLICMSFESSRLRFNTLQLKDFLNLWNFLFFLFFCS